MTGRTRSGSPGVHILTPLRIPESDTALLVNRGWVYSPDARTVDLTRWREVLAFGVFKGAALMVERIQETVPQLILGRLTSMTSVALYNRANALCGVPDRIIMSASAAPWPQPPAHR